MSSHAERQGRCHAETKSNPVCPVLNLRIGVRSYELRLQNTPKTTAKIIPVPDKAKS